MRLFFRIRFKLYEMQKRFRSFFLSMMNGKNLMLGRNVVIGGDVTMGNHCHVGDNSTIIGSVDLGENVFVHDNVLIRSFKHSITICEPVNCISVPYGSRSMCERVAGIRREDAQMALRGSGSDHGSAEHQRNGQRGKRDLV